MAKEELLEFPGVVRNFTNATFLIELKMAMRSTHIWQEMRKNRIRFGGDRSGGNETHDLTKGRINYRFK